MFLGDSRQKLPLYFRSISTSSIHKLMIFLDVGFCISDTTVGDELQTLREESCAAIVEDDAEAILLGFAGFAGFADELEIPVLYGVVCAVKFAEALVELGKSTSKYKTYRFPEPKTYTGTFEHFGCRS